MPRPADDRDDDSLTQDPAADDLAAARGLPAGLDVAALPPAARQAMLRLIEERDALAAEAAALRRRLAETELLADRDPLVPVLNRRAFLRELKRTAAFCERYQAAASVAFFDLDGFKAVNDRYGHAAGDAALAAAAQTLVDHVRESDVVGRLGGDEFAVILAQAASSDAEAKAASLAALIADRPVAWAGELIPLRASVGVRAFEPGMSAAQWLAEADAAMFLRKGLQA